jgi:hypothetical protein
LQLCWWYWRPNSRQDTYQASLNLQKSQSCAYTGKPNPKKRMSYIQAFKLDLVPEGKKHPNTALHANLQDLRRMALPYRATTNKVTLAISMLWKTAFSKSLRASLG